MTLLKCQPPCKHVSGPSVTTLNYYLGSAIVTKLWYNISIPRIPPQQEATTLIKYNKKNLRSDRACPRRLFLTGDALWAPLFLPFVLLYIRLTPSCICTARSPNPCMYEHVCYVSSPRHCVDSSLHRHELESGTEESGESSTSEPPSFSPAF